MPSSYFKSWVGIWDELCLPSISNMVIFHPEGFKMILVVLEVSNDQNCVCTNSELNKGIWRGARAKTCPNMKLSHRL